jgi:Transposase DDE domain group 1
MPSSHSPAGLVVAFDDDHAVANAGLLLPATLTERLGIEAAVDRLVDLGDRPGAHRPGRKVLTLLHAIIAGADCIDDAELLRTGSTAAVLGHRVMAPSTLGTFLRSFTFGHVRQLDRVAETIMGRAWAAGAGPGDGPVTIDLDSTICEVHGHHKGGAAFGYTRVLGYHPLLATRADTGEVLHARQRTGRAASGRGAERFVNELAGRIRRAGASGPLILRADSGLWAAKVLAACRRHGIQFSITVRQTKTVAAAIAAIGEHAWADIDYPDGGHAQVAETTLGADRLIVRRTRLVGPQATLWPDWRYHALVTDRQGSAITLDADHRRHAVCELAIRDLKDGAGLRHCPSGVFLANAAWLVLATLAHNLVGAGKSVVGAELRIRRRGNPATMIGA